MAMSKHEIQITLMIYEGGELRLTVNGIWQDLRWKDLYDMTHCRVPCHT